MSDTVLEMFTSELGASRGVSRRPLILYGHMAQVTAQQFAHHTTVCTIAVAGLAVLGELIARLGTLGLLAMSRTTHVGEAEAAIRMFNERSATRAMTLYGAWDYNVARAASRAVGCGADRVSMPGIDANEHFAYVFGVLKEVTGGAAAPATAAAHIARLKRYTTAKSPFWEQQDLIKSTYY